MSAHHDPIPPATHPAPAPPAAPRPEDEEFDRWTRVRVLNEAAQLCRDGRPLKDPTWHLFFEEVAAFIARHPAPAPPAAPRPEEVTGTCVRCQAPIYGSEGRIFSVCSPCWDAETAQRKLTDHPAPAPVDALREAEVTRFEVIDRRILGKGRAFVAHDIAVELSYQDDGRTLKVFVTDRRAARGAP